MTLRKEWPEDIRWIVDHFNDTDEARTRSRWSPRFFVAHRGKVILTATGDQGWKYDVLPLLQKLCGE
jgi:hypothetical protein